MTWDILWMALPLILLQAGLVVYCLVDLMRNGVKTLSKTWWLIIILLFQLTGSIAYLLAGRKGRS